MGRRKKEPGSVHRENIAAAAQNLFMQKGIEAASMDDIAKAAAYSKATLYVYFKSKEEIVGVLVLESMKKLYDRIRMAIEEQTGTRARYDAICQALLRYQEEFPFYFQIALGKINVDFNDPKFLPEEKETFDVGEQINRELSHFIGAGIRAGELRADIQIMPAIFSFWGMLSGLIQTASNKEAYIRQELHLSKQEFLTYGFDTLYRSISNTEVSVK